MGIIRVHLWKEMFCTFFSNKLDIIFFLLGISNELISYQPYKKSCHVPVMLSKQA
jgi:hypothetical protein